MRTFLVIAAVALAAGCAQQPPLQHGAATPQRYAWTKSMEAKRTALEKTARGSSISVLRSNDNQLQINVPSDFSFDPESAAIKPAMQPVLDEIVADLTTPALARMRILVVGHTDSRGAADANDALSVARALAVAKYFESKGVAAARIRFEGRGEREPLVANDQPYARALNRRVEVFLHEYAD